MMGKIERDNDVSPDEIDNCGATRSWQQWPDYRLAKQVAARRRGGDADAARARALPHCGGSETIDFKPSGVLGQRLSLPIYQCSSLGAEQRLRPSPQRWRKERTRNEPLGASTWRRADGARCGAVRCGARCAVRGARCARYLTVAARKSINFRPPGRVRCPAEQRLRPSLQRWRSEQMAIGRCQ